MTKLSKPKRVRENKAKCCNNCSYLSEVNCGFESYMICKRDPEGAPWAEFGDGDMGIHMVVCDGHKSKAKK